MLEVQHLAKRFGTVRALDDVSFSLASGGIHGLVGSNGAGKSTLIKVVAGYLMPSAGRVFVGEFDLLAFPRACRRLTGYLPEGCPLYNEFRVGEHLRYRAQLKGLHGRRLRVRLRHVMAVCNLGELHRKVIRRLSLGERQRVGLADAILTEPRLLLLDEPFAGLDALQMKACCDMLNEMSRHSTILMATHRLDVVEQLCRSCTLLEAGRVLGNAWTPDEVAAIIDRAKNRGDRVEEEGGA